MPDSQPASEPHTDIKGCQIRETVMMLNLAIVRIEHAMREGSESIGTLTHSFTSMVDSVQNIKTATEALAGGPAKTAIQQDCEQVADKVQAAIMAFQFYDKLSQRLTHVSKSLASLTELVSDEDRLFNPQEWQALQQKIRAKYTLDSDLQMCDAILQGKSMEEILSMTAPAAEQQEDIELF